MSQGIVTQIHIKLQQKTSTELGQQAEEEKSIDNPTEHLALKLFFFVILSNYCILTSLCKEAGFQIKVGKVNITVDLSRT